MTCQKLILSTYPCHLQAVEQTIIDVSAFSSKVYGHKSQHGVVVLGKKARPK